MLRYRTCSWTGASLDTETSNHHVGFKLFLGFGGSISKITQQCAEGTVTDKPETIGVGRFRWRVACDLMLRDI